MAKQWKVIGSFRVKGQTAPEARVFGPFTELHQAEATVVQLAGQRNGECLAAEVVEMDAAPKGPRVDRSGCVAKRCT